MPPDDHQTEELRSKRTTRSRRATRRTAAETPFLTAGARLRERRYVLERQLGRGGMAAVWLARDERLERPVAIKVLSDTLAGDRGYLARFQREARVAAGLQHPSLVNVFDYGTEGGRPFLVMEYVAGGDLGERLAAGRAPDPDRLAHELLGALRHIHAAGVLHRDVKPQNVLLGRDGRARLTDFGIAQPRDATSLTQTGMVLGTARYLAPEVLEGGPPSERSDLYSLGVVLAETHDARPGSGALAELIAALRSPEPDARPESAPAALRRLEGAGPATPEPATPATVPRPEAQRPVERLRSGDRQPRLSRPLAIGALAAAALAVLVLAVLTGGGEEPRPTPPVAQTEPGGDGAGEAEGAGDRQGDRLGGEGAGANGFALNDRGFALINEGRPGEAIPLLERAVDALEGSGEITYAYALFNLGKALRLAGRPEEAVPILEARLEIPNQTGVVREELELARAAALGEDDDRSRGRGRGRGRGGDD